MVTRKEFQAHTLFHSATALLASEPSNILQMVTIVSPIEVEGAMLIPHGIYYSVFTLIRRIPLQNSVGDYTSHINTVLGLFERGQVRPVRSFSRGEIINSNQAERHQLLFSLCAMEFEC